MTKATILAALAIAACSNEPLDDGDQEHEGIASQALVNAGNTYAFARGCFSDQSNRALPAFLGNNMTIESCIATANSYGYTFAGVQYYGECWAGNALGYNPLPASSCNTPCAANTNEMCGGTWANSIFQMMTPGSTTWPGWPSASSVAPSWLWDAGWDASPCGLFGDGASKHCNLPISGTQTMYWNGMGASLVELRGWIYPGGPNGDPDYEYDFELDPEWAASALGLSDLNPILKVGNILNMQKPPSENEGTYSRAVATPLVHVELSGWKISGHPNDLPPPDWQTYGINGDVLWAFKPDQFYPGQYVRMIGSLITDEPHCTGDGDLKDAVRKWARSGCSTNFDSHNPARWAEMHSPDLIQPIAEPANARDVTVKAVADVAENGLFSGETNTIDADIWPPAYQLVNGVCPYGITVDERVGGETNYGTITDGNATLSGARIDRYADHVHVHVTVHGQGGYGAPGKFKAIYKVACAACTPSCGGKCGGGDGCGGTCPTQACPSNEVCGGAGYCTCSAGTAWCALTGTCAASCGSYCGDGVCDGGETPNNCSADCGCPTGTSDCCDDGVCRTPINCRRCLL